MQAGATLSFLLRHIRVWPVAVLLGLGLGGCAATTTVKLTPSPQTPVCASASKALVVWTTGWRSDQKDVPAREAAATEGIDRFFQKSGCFVATTVLRVAQSEREAAIAAHRAGHEKVLVLVVRELGPTLALGASAALIEGATEVALDISEYTGSNPAPRSFTVQWRSGGAGVIKGVATLPQDLQAALAAALQPGAR